MYAVLKNIFFNSKIDLFLELKTTFYFDFWIPHPKKYRGAHFHEDWLYGTQVVTISLDTENSKWWISEKKLLKLPKF